MKKNIKFNQLISRDELNKAFHDSQNMNDFVITFFSSLLSNIVLKVFDNNGGVKDDFNN